MTQSDLKLEHAGVSGPAFAGDAQEAVRAAATCQFGPTEPPTLLSGLVWIDSSATPWIVKVRNGANDAWIELFRIDDTDDTLTIALKLLTMAGQILGFGGTVGAPGYAFSGDADTGVYRPGANEIAIVAGGSEILRIAGTLITALKVVRLPNLPTASLPAPDAANLGALAYDSTLATIVGNLTGNAWKDLTAGGAFETALMHVRDEKASGTDGGSSTAGSWQTRDLNTVLTNEIAGADLISNRPRLPVGTYYIEALAPAKRAQNHKIKLRNVSQAVDTLVGQNVNSNTDDTSTNANLARLQGRFATTGFTAFEIQHQVQAGRATDGLGAAAAFGVPEVYTDVRIWKVG